MDLTNIVERASQIQGWMWEEELKWLTERAQNMNNIVEIGSWKGRSTVALTVCRGTVHALDHWRGAPNNLAYTDLETKTPYDIQLEFVGNLFQELADRKVQMWEGDRLESLELLRELIEPIDMVFIDANHEYHAVMQDIDAAIKLLKPGGLLCGHDYARTDPGVIQAVEERFPHKRVYCSIWSVYV